MSTSTQVRDMFASIAHRYDAANQVLSWGIHRLWRRAAVRHSGLQGSEHVLDCATGTGDLALAYRRALGPNGRVTATDFCAPMLELAPAKAQRAGLTDITFQLADALSLPFPAAHFDLSTMAFGIRNVTDPVACLREMARVVKPGGRVVVMEFGQPAGLFGVLYRFYTNVVLPRMGGLLSGSRSAYEYLNRTSAAFPSGARFVALMDTADCFRTTQAVALTFGAVFVYVGKVR